MSNYSRKQNGENFYRKKNERNDYNSSNYHQSYGCYRPRYNDEFFPYRGSYVYDDRRKSNFNKGFNSHGYHKDKKHKDLFSGEKSDYQDTFVTSKKNEKHLSIGKYFFEPEVLDLLELSNDESEIISENSLFEEIQKNWITVQIISQKN